jgi:tetratricopeptide (TPR) repeat protein
MGRPPAPLGPEWDHTPARAHNEVLHVLATQGLLGAAALLVLAAGLAWAAVRAWSRGPDRLLAAALAGSVLAFCVQDLFSFTVAGCAVLFVTVAGLLSRLGEPTGEGAREAPAGARWDAGAVVFGALLGFLVVLGNVADDSAPAAARRWVGCAVVGLALALSALAAVRPSRWTGGAGLLSPAPAWLRLVQAGVGVAALGAAWEWVLPPVLADRACLEGDQLLAEAPARALACYERAVGLAPGRDVYWFKLGAAAQASAGSADDRERRGRLVRARQALEQACALVPASPDHHANLARLRALLASEGLAEPDGAFNEFDAALAGDPFNTLFLADAGQSAAALGLKERARRYLRRGLELDPTLPALEVGVATLALQEGRLTEAEGHLAKAVGSARWQDEEARWQGVALLGLARLRLRRFEEARRLADMVLEQRPAWVHVRLTRAEALEGLGRKAEAADEYRRVVALAPGFGPARAALVRLTTGP